MGEWRVERVNGQFVAECPHGVLMPDGWASEDRAWRDTLEGCPCAPDPMALTDQCAKAVMDR